MDPILTPIEIKGLKLRNRVVMAPMTRNRSFGGVPASNVAAYYARRASAGVGLIVTEGIGIDHPAALGGLRPEDQNIPFLYGEAPLAGWRAVTAAVHAAGGLILPQLWHTGPLREPGTGPYPEAPSCRPSGVWGPTDRRCTMPEEYRERVAAPSRPMTDEEIADLSAAYIRSAANAIAAGFDGVALHGAHGYMFDAFFWKETNRRDDRWGGDIARRAAFAAETIRGIRREIGPDWPIMFRFSNWKLQDYHARLFESPADLEAMLGPLVEAGVDMFDVSTRRFNDPAFEGSDLTLAGWAKKVAGLPTMAVGGVGVERDLWGGKPADGAGVEESLAILRRRLEAGEFDLVGVGRALLIDPTFVDTIAAGGPFKRLTKELVPTFYDSRYELV